MQERLHVADWIIYCTDGFLGNCYIDKYISLVRFSKPPFLTIISRYKWESHAMLPKAHIACYTIPTCEYNNISTNIFIPPFYIIVWVCYVVPAAILVKHHTAYNYNWGYYVCLAYDIIRGMRPESITCWIGGFFFYDNNLRIPIRP
jgi:hypothetical protein